MHTIYLDHNSTTPVLPVVAEAIRHSESVAYGNPASAHGVGRVARRAVDDARERIAALLVAHPDEVTFTSGATEANNLAVLGLLPTGGAAIGSHLEHPCVVEPLRHLAAHGTRVEWWPVDSRGVIMPAPISPGVKLVCVMLANHETGAIQPVRKVAETLPAGTALHCDAAQALGKITVNFQSLGVTTLTASAHKFGGPKGVGILITKRGVKLAPQMFGGHQQRGRRPGTEPVPLTVGMAVALEQTVANLAANRAKLEALRARFWERLAETASPIVLNGPEIGAMDVVPTTLNVSFPGCRADLLLMALDLAGVACSTGSACSSGSLLPSPVLRAMCVPENVLQSALRFSFCPGTDFADIDEAARRIGIATHQLRESGKME